MADHYFLHDINFYEPNLALGAVMAGTHGRLAPLLETISLEIALLYALHVAKKTGDLSRSADAFVRPNGGHLHDRLVGVTTVAGASVESVWDSPANPNPNGEFYYGVLHEFGSPTKHGRFPAAEDLEDVTRAYVATKGHFVE